MNHLKRIPSPPGHLVREFCHSTLPIVAFLAAGLGTAYLWNERFAGSVVPADTGRAASSLHSQDLDHPVESELASPSKFPPNLSDPQAAPSI